MQIEIFIAYLESVYRFHTIQKDKLNSLIDGYSKLDFHNSSDDLNKKIIIDNVFETLYGSTLEKLITDFTSESKLRKIESEESRLRKRVADLEETVGELRDSYWNVKQANISMSKSKSMNK
jgi:hypothetical protein